MVVRVPAAPCPIECGLLDLELDVEFPRVFQPNLQLDLRVAVLQLDLDAVVALL